MCMLCLLCTLSLLRLSAEAALPSLPGLLHVLCPRACHTLPSWNCFARRTPPPTCPRRQLPRPSSPRTCRPPCTPSAPPLLLQVTQNEGLRMLCSKAQAIDELESTIPAWVEAWFPGLYPPYLHVLRVDPDKLDAVRWVGWVGGWAGKQSRGSAHGRSGCR